MTVRERYDTIMSRVEKFDSRIDDRSHEDIAEFYQIMFDSLQSVTEELFSILKAKEADHDAP